MRPVGGGSGPVDLGGIASGRARTAFAFAGAAECSAGRALAEDPLAPYAQGPRIGLLLRCRGVRAAPREDGDGRRGDVRLPRVTHANVPVEGVGARSGS